ncbi:MAG: asparaginase [Rhodospirillaceae bacterium]
MRTKVLVLYTGGTIGAVPEVPDHSAGPLRPAGKERLRPYIPNPLGGIAWDIIGLTDENGAPVPPLDSASVGPKQWLWMARAIERHYPEYDGFVILHGTDTMAYTGSALSFLLENLAKPVVMTGSQLPIFQTDTDAVINFTNALRVAGYKATGLPRVPEVTIAFADRLLRANRATKISTINRRGFDSFNLPPLGSFGEHVSINTELIRKTPEPGQYPFFVYPKLDSRMMPFSIFPGMRTEHLKSILDLSDIKGFVLLTFGSGNAPDDTDFLRVVSDAVRAGKTIVNVTQCLEGKVEMGRYTTGSGLQAAGVISGRDMTFEAALTKLMWLSGNPENGDMAAEMLVDRRGELS